MSSKADHNNKAVPYGAPFFKDRGIVMKVSVYAICKNEAQFVRRWMDSMSEADEVVVLDTGSADDTAAILRELGARVQVETVTPWRFDVARNRSLELVSEDTDICVCTDLDEVFRPGWRQALEKSWRPGTGRARYHYIWSFEPDGSEGVSFRGEKIHSRHGWRWTHPVHEVLSWIGEGRPGRWVEAEGVRLEHYPDHTKSRGQYLPLLELSVEEDPQDDRNMHYLGREYFYHGRWDDCIHTLTRHLALPGATWADERAASMRYMAQAYENKGDAARAERWYLSAVGQAPHLRETWLDLAMHLQRQEQWDGVVYATGRALDITHRAQTYMTQGSAWGSMPWDLRSVALFHTGRPEQALEAALRAQELSGQDERIRRNVDFIRQALEEKKNAG